MGTVQSAAARAGDHPLLERGARLGYAASGVLHLLIAWVTLQLAWGSPVGGQASSADQQGALRELGQGGGGRALLVVLLVGFVLLTLWQVTDALAWGEASHRAKAAGKAVVYAVLAWSTVQVLTAPAPATPAGGSGGSTTATLLQSTGGRAVVAAVGAGVLAVALYHVAKGWRATFLRDLERSPGPWAVRAGRIGYVGKGAALAVVGVLLLLAAVRSDPSKAQGLDAALHTLAALPFGAVLLTLVATGFAAYGCYAFARARYARV